MDLSLQHITTTTDGSISFQWTDTDFPYTDIVGSQLRANGSIAGNGSVAVNAYFDNSNAQFGTGILAASAGPFGAGSFGQIVSGPGPTAAPFSMTEVVNVTLTAKSVIGGDFMFLGLPSPLQLTCASSAGVVGAPYNSALLATGGIMPYTFSILSGSLPSGLILNPSTGAITGTPTQPGVVAYTAQVIDSSGATAGTVTTSCSITATQPPPLSLFCPISTGQAGVPYSSALAASGGIPPYTYSISAGALPDGLVLNPSTGAITGKPTTPGTFNFTAQVVDSRGNLAGTLTSDCAITITPPPTANCVSITAVQGVAITPVTMTASGGTGGPYTFSASGLPAGLTLSTTGTMSGTPTVSGIFSYTVTVIDKDGHTGTINCSLTVNPPVSVSCVNITAIQGVVITPVTMTASGGAGGPYTFSASGLPAGLTMSSTGTISGTPTVSGTFSYTVTVKDKDGNTGTAGCSVTVSTVTNVCGLTWGYWKNHLSAWPVTSLVLGSQTYTQAELTNLLGLPVAGDASINLAHQLIAAKLNVLNGTNPSTDGGAISAADALLSTFSGKLPYGVPSSSTVGTQMTTTAGALDYFNSDGAAQPGCTAGPSALSLACAAKTGQVGAPYSSAFVVTGGVAPYTFSIVSGTLPPGLTLNLTTGALTGTPTMAGTFSFTVQVSDSTAIPGSSVGSKQANCSITITAPVSAPLLLACAASTGQFGFPYSSVLVASGGAPPYGPYSIASGSLPGGLTLNTSTGAITGTPTTAGTFSFNASVVDSRGAAAGTATSSCSITVASALQPLAHGDTATIGFWHNKNGQALINSLNGGSTSTALATWLATNFPKLYGSASTHNLTGKTNADVAALFMTFFNVKGTKTDAQVLAGALAVYVTDSDLAGSAAAAYGFNVSSTGTGAKVYNTGSNGTAIGLLNNTSYTILQLLQAANAAAPYSSGAFDALNTIFDGINTGGDIT